MRFLKIYIFLLLLFAKEGFGAKCPPCICIETSSPGLSSTYLFSQSSVLNGFVMPSIDDAIQKVNNAIETSNAALFTINERRAGELILLSEHKKTIMLLNKIEKKYVSRILMLLNELKQSNLQQEITLKNKED